MPFHFLSNLTFLFLIFLPLSFCLQLSFLSGAKKKTFLAPPSMKIKIPLKHYPLHNQVLEFLMKDEKDTADSSNLMHETLLKNFKNSQFIGEIAFGDTENKFQVIFDTGSSNIWINSIYCLDDGCLAHKKLNGSLSKTYISTNKTLNVEFGSGDLKGKLSADTVFFANIPIENQFFVEIYQEMGAVFSKVAFDGIVGLGFKPLSAQGSTPIFDQIIEKKQLNMNIFSFVLNKNKESQLMLGGFDSKHIEGEIQYHDLIEEVYWTIQMDKILLNGEDTNLCENCKAIIDTGTSLITGPTKAIKKLNSLLKINKKCQNIKNLPEITFVIDKIHYSIKPQDYLLYLDKIEDNIDTRCMSLLMPLDIPESRGPAWILGDLFLMNYLSIFDRDQNRIGLAKLKEE